MIRETPPGRPRATQIRHNPSEIAVEATSDTTGSTRERFTASTKATSTTLAQLSANVFVGCRAQVARKAGWFRCAVVYGCAQLVVAARVVLGAHELGGTEMLILATSIRVDGITGMEIFDFLANPDDESYRAWWPGTHLQLHTLARGDNHIGDVVFMDEYVGTRRLRMTAIVTEAAPGKKLAWQLRRWIKLPAHLHLEFDDHDGGVTITHTTCAGFRGPGRILDPALRLFFSRAFADALDEHVRTEFPLLRDLLRKRRLAALAEPSSA